MRKSIDWHGDEMILEGCTCPNCGSNSTEFEPVFQNWKCEDCSTVWPDESGSLVSDEEDDLASIFPDEGYCVPLPPGVTTIEGLQRWCNDKLGLPPSEI